MSNPKGETCFPQQSLSRSFSKRRLQLIIKSWDLEFKNSEVENALGKWKIWNLRNKRHKYTFPFIKPVRTVRSWKIPKNKILHINRILCNDKAPTEGFHFFRSECSSFYKVLNFNVSSFSRFLRWPNLWLLKITTQSRILRGSFDKYWRGFCLFPAVKSSNNRPG